jgi:hypothetical protein
VDGLASLIVRQWSALSRSVTVARRDDHLPLELESGSQALTVTIGQVSPFSRFRSQPELDTFDRELGQRGFQVEHLGNPGDDLLLAKAAESDVVFLNLVALPYMTLGTIRNLVGHLGHWAWRSLFVEHPHVLVTSLGNPYVLHEMPHLPNLLLAYGDSEVSQCAAVKVCWARLVPKATACDKPPATRVPRLTVICKMNHSLII